MFSCHHFCRKCLIDWLGRAATCPACRQPSAPNQCEDDVRKERELRTLEVRCRVNPDCPVTGKLGRDEFWRTHPASCSYKCNSLLRRSPRVVPLPVMLLFLSNSNLVRFSDQPCPYCGKRLIAAALDDHSLICPFNPYRCQHCRTLVPARESVRPAVRCRYQYFLDWASMSSCFA